MDAPGETPPLKEQIVRLLHIGFVVPELEAALAALGDVYGLAAGDIRYLPTADGAPARFAFARIAGTEFELIEAISDEMKHLLQASPAGPGGINHVAWEVRDLAHCQHLLEARGIRPGHVTPRGAVDTGASRLLYLDPDCAGGMLVELVQQSPPGGASARGVPDPGMP